MNLVDWVMIGAIVVFALVGWRQGFLTGALSFLGFLGGGLLAVLLLPEFVERFISSPMWRIVALALAILASALIAQTLLSMIGRRLRESMTWRPVRFVDSSAGAVLNVAALALVAWVIASVVTYLPQSEMTRQVGGSSVLTTMDRVLPDAARSAFTSLQDLVGTTAVPRVFSGLAPIPGNEVDPPVEAAAAEAVSVIRDSTVRLSGIAPACDSVVSGSGFAVESDLVVTNAHVVAGVEELTVRVRPGQFSRKAEVVYFDPDTDIALVRAEGLQARPVRLAREPMIEGQPAVVAGFPRGERFAAAPARVRAQVLARGESIYGDRGVERDVYVLRGSVQQGNSGGPLTDEFGEVHGVVFASGMAEEDVAYALTTQEIRKARAAAGEASRAVPNGSCELR
ncbi:MAG TPA: MarP family serine protease [Candidatus Nanopelagicales bacterium]|nr:MarP family serine protease [Candidatus Nanopelagicales bacterium]